MQPSVHQNRRTMPHMALRHHGARHAIHIAALPRQLILRQSFHPVHTAQRGSVRRRGCSVIRAAMFEGLSKGLSKAWDIVRRDGKLTESNIKEPMREIRRALLEADVSLPVVRRFVARVQENALGKSVLKGVSPEQQLVKVVNDELIELMGKEQVGLNDVPKGPQVVLMAGLQGVGKTTACGKLALYLQKSNKRVVMVSTDVYRPAAIEQLVRLGQRIDVPVYEYPTTMPPVQIAANGLQRAKQDRADVIIVDTAGRLQVDEDMMRELKDIQTTVKPSDTLLVVDAMTGQEAANLAKAFNEAVGITGAVMTKMDGDSRGGAALTVREVSGKPIKFIGTGEKLDALEAFYPDRLASRILGMGDILSLVEKAEATIKAEEAQEMTAKLMSNKFDLNDFLAQYKMVARMGGMNQLARMMPGMNAISDKQLAEAEKKFMVFEAMVNSMTKEERMKPELLVRSASRRRRIARGSGRSETEVQELLALFTNMRAQMKVVQKMMAMGGMTGMQGMPGMDDEEMMQELLQSIGPQKPAPGTVRRRKIKVKKQTTTKKLKGVLSW